LAGLAALAATALEGTAPARAAACADLALGRAEARPFEAIPFPETVDALLVSLDGAEPLRLPLAAGTFVVPPHPVTPLEGGVVELAAADVDGSCPLGDLTIAALPRATGAIAREAADIAKLISDIRTLSVGGAPLPSIETAPDALVPLALLVAMGEAVAADLATLSGDPLTEALFAAASAQTRARVPRRRADAPPVSPRRHARALVSRFAEIVAGLSPIGTARAVELELDTTGLLCPEDAESLRRMAWMQIEGEAASLPEVS
ncbi:hypothetical protein, partial [Salinarimonas ramus]|uniref:hypothetical protein n=1 Tax=Salinarimonas ramus TaxID=690164 RepID=UPI00166D91E6